MIGGKWPSGTGNSDRGCGRRHRSRYRRFGNAVNGFIGRTDHILVKNDRDARWPIPVGIRYETFIKIPQELYKHGADSKPIRPAKIADLMSINKQTIGGNLAFLASVGIVKRAKPRSYKLLSLGTKYAEAHAAGDDRAVKRVTLNMIRKSHLRSLLDILDGGNPEWDEIYAWIKAKGRYPDGRGTGGMHPPTGTGARTLLRIFADAGLVPIEMTDESGSAQRKPRAAKGKRKRRSAPETDIDDPVRKPRVVRGKRRRHSALETYIDDPIRKPRAVRRKQKRRSATPETGEAPHPAHDPVSRGMVSITGVGSIDVSDSDTLDIAESYMRLLRKKIGRARGK